MLKLKYQNLKINEVQSNMSVDCNPMYKKRVSLAFWHNGDSIIFL